MNILIIPSWYPSDPGDTYGSFFREQAVALKDAGHNVFVLNGTFAPLKTLWNREKYKFDIQQDKGIITLRKILPSAGFSRFPSLCTYFFQKRIDNLLSVLEKMYKSITFDVIHAHSCYPAGITACRIGNELDVPVVITEHRSMYIHQSVKNNQEEILRRCLRDSQSFICVSDALRENIAKLTDTPVTEIRVLPNMVSDLFHLASTEKSNSDSFRFISVGALNPGKRHLQLVKCFHRAFMNDESTSLTIVGEGPERREIEHYISENQLLNRVVLTGRLSRENVASEMQHSDAFVLSSAFETFGIVYIEAMACGLPVIATQNGGAEDVVTKDNGILIKVDDDDALIAALQKMRQERNSFDSMGISQKTISQYGSKKISEELTQIYNRLIAQKVEKAK